MLEALIPVLLLYSVYHGLIMSMCGYFFIFGAILPVYINLSHSHLLILECTEPGNAFAWITMNLQISVRFFKFDKAYLLSLSVFILVHSIPTAIFFRLGAVPPFNWSPNQDNMTKFTVVLWTPFSYQYSIHRRSGIQK